MIIRIIIVLLCLVGLYASVFMTRKTLRAARGEIAEPSVVKMPSAHLIAGISNAEFGVAYYAALVIATPFLSTTPVWWAAFIASLGAASMSVYLAYSLLFRTKMECPYCWTSHITNWTLVVLLLLSHSR